MEGTKTAPVKERTAGESAAIAGQATFNAKCGKCHGLKPAGDYTAERWAQILAVMAPWRTCRKQNAATYMNTRKGQRQKISSSFSITYFSPTPFSFIRA